MQISSKSYFSVKNLGTTCWMHEFPLKHLCMENKNKWERKNKIKGTDEEGR